MADGHKNFSYSTVATAPSPASSGLSLVVQTGEGANFPATPFNATIWPVNSQPTVTNAEIVQVTGISIDTLTIVRQQEGTNARTVVIGDQIAATITAKTLTEIEGNRAPTVDVIIQPGYCMHVCGDFEIASGNTLEIGLNGALEIT